MHLGPAQDQEVVEALAPHVAEEALAGGVLARCPVGRPQFGDAGRRRDTGERLTVVLAVYSVRGSLLALMRRYCQ